MCIQGVSLPNPHSSNDVNSIGLINKFPPELLKKILNFLNPQEVDIAKNVCTLWRYSAKELINENFRPPEVIRQMFFSNDRLIKQLPILHLGDRMGQAGYIDFLQPEDMSHPVMKFIDMANRPGIAFKIVVYSRLEKTLELSLCKLKIRYAYSTERSFKKIIPEIKNFMKILINWQKRKERIFVLFQRYRDEKDIWVHAESYHFYRIKELYEERHLPNSGFRHFCKSCPFEGNMPKVKIIQDLLNNTDPDFKLSSTKEKISYINKILIASLFIFILSLTLYNLNKYVQRT